MEVRREDQEKINRFSSLHQKEDALEEELRAKIVRFYVGLYLMQRSLTFTQQKEKEDLEEISTELELVDEEDKVPYVCQESTETLHMLTCYRYKVGDCFVSLPQTQVLELLEASTESIDSDVDELKSRLEAVQEEMGELKKALYGRFGRSINLET